MVLSFGEYGVEGVKNGVCPVCGRVSRRTKKFYQTQNPFNKNKNGEVKSISEIIAECETEMELWKNDLCFHVKCERQYEETGV